tara:strand:+ start:1161 stop:1565 length:405 start_codon:yes stop_codon:yes gene_type:complete
MDENKLKHNFVKKEKQLDTNGWVQSATRYCNTHGNGRIYPEGVVDGINVNYETRPRPEISPVEEVIVERVLSPEILRTYGNQREELITTIKQDMAKELGSLLLESGYVVSVESIIPENFNTKIKMMVKTKKLEQ